MPPLKNSILSLIFAPILHSYRDVVSPYLKSSSYKLKCAGNFWEESSSYTLVPWKPNSCTSPFFFFGLLGSVRVCLTSHYIILIILHHTHQHAHQHAHHPIHQRTHHHATSLLHVMSIIGVSFLLSIVSVCDREWE